VSLASKAGVSPYYARKVVKELTVTGCLRNPCSTKGEKTSHLALVSISVVYDFELVLGQVYEYAGTYKVPNLVPIDKWMYLLL
jgi:hypothetical protein